MGGGQVSSGIRVQRVGEMRGVAEAGHKLGHFRQCWFGSHTASAVLQMKIVPHSREQARWVYNGRPFRSQKQDSELCEVSPWRFWCWAEQATSSATPPARP